MRASNSVAVKVICIPRTLDGHMSLGREALKLQSVPAGKRHMHMLQISEGGHSSLDASLLVVVFIQDQLTDRLSHHHSELQAPPHLLPRGSESEGSQPDDVAAPTGSIAKSTDCSC